MTDQGGGDLQAQTSYRIEAVDYAIEILSVIAAEPDLPMSEIARRLGGSRQRIFRMLKTLEASGMIEKLHDGKSFRLGYRSLVIGNSARNQMDIVRLSEPMMAALGAEVQETVQLRIRDGLETVCVARWEPERDIRVHAVIGRRRPLHAGSSKMFLAFMPEDDRESYLARPLISLTDRTVVDKVLLRNRLMEIRRAGFLISEGEVSDELASIAAPVFGANRNVVAVLNIAAPVARLDRQTMLVAKDRAVAASIRLSRSLGYPAS